MQLIERIVAFCCRNALAVVAGSLLLAVAAGWYTADNFAMNSNSATLISPDTDWRKREIRFDALFPQHTNLILVVIDGKTPELAEAAAAAITQTLSADKAHFISVNRPDGGEFFDHNGLLFLPTAEVKSTTAQLFQAQPFLGALAADPSLRGVMDSLSAALMGVEQGQASLADIDKPMQVFGASLAAATKGQTQYMSWRGMISGAPRPEELRRFIEVRPRLDFQAREPGAAASKVIRDAAKALPGADGVRVRLTGDVPLADEEFGTLADRAELMVGAMLAGVLLTLWLALRSFKIIFAILVTLFVGLAWTMAIGLWSVGVFNIISIAFIALFVGLGVDFGIQFSVRYRCERFHQPNLAKAVIHTGRNMGMPLALAALATAVGFFSFLPTNYTGVAELGLVAGVGMVMAFVTAITLLPALLVLLKPGSEARDVGFESLARVDHYMQGHRRTVLRVAVLAGLISLGLTWFLRFDSNPLDLRSPSVESVSTLFDLMGNPQTSPNGIDVLAPSLAEADRIAARLSKLPEVAMALTLSSFVPEDQTAKLAVITDANTVLDSTLNPFEVKPAPTDADVVASFRAITPRLVAAAAKTSGAPADHARQLAANLTALADGPAANRAHAEAAMIAGLKILLAQTSNILSPQAVSLSTMPAAMRAEWVANNGTARVQVLPRDTSNDPEKLAQFSAAVRTIAPAATGAPISIRESGNTIVRAFAWAGLLSFIAITFLLIIFLKRARDVILTLAPLVLAGLLTLASCVVLGLPLNFANIIALPLLLGIGVAFNIYFVVAWRAGAHHFLQTALTRAVIFSAATTASGFGTLWLSSHPGTASMGELLMISLGWTLVTTLFVSPALMGPPPPRREQAHEKLIDD